MKLETDPLGAATLVSLTEVTPETAPVTQSIDWSAEKEREFQSLNTQRMMGINNLVQTLRPALEDAVIGAAENFNLDDTESSKFYTLLCVILAEMAEPVIDALETFDTRIKVDFIPLTPPAQEDIAWVVTDQGEVGVMIQGRVFTHYKGESLARTNTVRVRPVEKRELGETLYCPEVAKIRNENQPVSFAQEDVTMADAAVRQLVSAWAAGFDWDHAINPAAV